MNEQRQPVDVAIVGGGLAGLAAAALLARGGRSVTLFERSPALGGRAATHNQGPFKFNQGPHALYRGGPAESVLQELGVQYRGAVPAVSGSYALDRGRRHALPGGFFSLVTTGLLNLPAKFEVARLLGTIGRIDPEPLQRVTVQDWLESRIRHAEVRRLVGALVRVSSYTNCPERMSAGAALLQIQAALTKLVKYLDGGWQVLVDGLQRVALAAGAQIAAGSRVTAVEHDGRVRGVHLADGTRHEAGAVIIAASPAVTRDLVGGAVPRLASWAAEAVPVKAACLDIGLSRLPQPRARFALGIDRPYYFSVHSAIAQLGPAGTAMIHVAKYLNPSETQDAKEDERELEGVLDLMQPGWRKVLVERRFLPGMVVANAVVTAATGGTRGRPGSAVPEIENLFLAGDWVGPDGMLADASLASAKQAASLLLARSKAVTARAA